MCRVLDVSRSGYYAWLKRGSSARAKANTELLETIREIHAESDGTYGAPRVHAELVERPQGPTASLNRVARVMRWAGLQGVSVRTERFNLEYESEESIKSCPVFLEHLRPAMVRAVEDRKLFQEVSGAVDERISRLSRQNAFTVGVVAACVTGERVA